MQVGQKEPTLSQPDAASRRLTLHLLIGPLNEVCFRRTQAGSSSHPPVFPPLNFSPAPHPVDWQILWIRLQNRSRICHLSPPPTIPIHLHPFSSRTILQPPDYALCFRFWSLRSTFTQMLVGPVRINPCHSSEHSPRVSPCSK